MKADRTYILTFGGPDSAESDREVRNCAAALHFKYTSRSRWVEWLHYLDGRFLRVTANGASRALLPDALPETRPHALPEEAAATATTSTAADVSALVSRPIVKVYAISHGGAGTFGGFPSPEVGAVILRGFMDTVGIDTIDQLSLVACATAKGPTGASFLEQLGRAMGEHQRPGNGLKIIGWANYVTIFDTRFLVRLLTDATIPITQIETFRTELLGSIRERAGSELGFRFAEELDGDFQAMISTPALGKAFKPAHIGSVQAAIRDQVGAMEIGRRLFGKKVVRATASVMFFTSPTGLTGSSDALQLPDTLPSEAAAALQAAVQHKKSQTFVWQTNVETGTSYLAPATDS